MAGKLKSSYDLAMERLQAAHPDAGNEKPLTAAQKEKITEAKRVAVARLAELEIHFHDASRRRSDPAEREKAEAEYQIDRRGSTRTSSGRSRRSGAGTKIVPDSLTADLGPITAKTMRRVRLLLCALFALAAAAPRPRTASLATSS